MGKLIDREKQVEYVEHFEAAVQFFSLSYFIQVQIDAKKVESVWPKTPKTLETRQAMVEKTLAAMKEVKTLESLIEDV